MHMSGGSADGRIRLLECADVIEDQLPQINSAIVAMSAEISEALAEANAQHKILEMPGWERSVYGTASRQALAYTHRAKRLEHERDEAMTEAAELAVLLALLREIVAKPMIGRF